MTHTSHPESPTTTAATGDADVPATHTAVVARRYGSPDVIAVETVDVPTPGPSQVLVRVRAAGLDRGTEHLLTGEPLLIRLLGFGFRRPAQPVLGFDVAGEVVAVGDEVTRFAVGDEVFGIGSGSFAEFAVAEEKKLSHRPDDVAAVDAGVVAVSGSTALQALTDVGELEPGQSVLVVGASGGVGTYAVQLARALGAGRVDGVAGVRNLDLVRSIGADEVFDHGTDWRAGLDGRYDLVVDIGGRTSVRQLRRLLTERGTLVMVGGEGGNRFTGGVGRQMRAALRSPFARHRLAMFMSQEHQRFLDRLVPHLQSGAVKPVIGRTVGLDGVADAMRDLGAGRSQGKTAVVPTPAA